MSDVFTIKFPAVRGIQAGRPFYLATVPFKVLGKFLQLDTAGAVLERSQRDVNVTRANGVSTYIIDNKESYIIPSLTGVINSTDPVAFILPFPSSTEAENSFSDIGLLSVPMDAVIKLFDGQHRASGIIKALITNPELGNESLPVMFFTDMTLEERQQAFSDINGTVAKPQQALCDSYNTRDGLPMLAKYVAANCKTFADLVEYANNSITAKSDNLFPIKTLKDASQALLAIKKNEEITEDHKRICVDFWQAVGDSLGWSLEAITASGSNPKAIRNDTIKTHTVMIKALAVAGNYIVSTSLDGAIKSVDWSKLQTLDFNRSSSEFHGRCIDEKTNGMVTNVTALKLTANKIIATLGGKLSDEMIELEDKHFPDAQCYFGMALANPVSASIQKVFPEKKADKVAIITEHLLQAFEINNVEPFINNEMTIASSMVLDFINNVMQNSPKRNMWAGVKFMKDEVTKFCIIRTQTTNKVYGLDKTNAEA